MLLRNMRYKNKLKVTVFKKL